MTVLRRARGRLLAGACLLGLALALAFEAAPAAASPPIAITPDVSTSTSVMQPLTRAVTTPSAIAYQGGPVLHTNRTYLVFWAPQNRPELRFAPGYMALMERFLSDVARASRSTSSTYGITGQYRDSQGPAAYASTYGGHVLDSDSAPANGCTEPAAPVGPGWSTCLSQSQLQRELGHVIAAHHLPKASNDIYFIVTPDGFGNCQAAGPSDCALGGSDGGYCGYHTSSDTGVLYAVIPFNAVAGHCQSTNPRPNRSTADPALSTLSHEQAETVTDPYLDAWVNPGGQEIADLCITAYGPAQGGTGNTMWNETIAGGHFWLQELYSRITGGCAARPQADSAAILPPARVVAGRPARLRARAAQPGGRVVGYNWNFGDRHGGRGSRPVHTYARAGRYRVYLRTTDSAGNWAYAKRTVVVTRR